MDWVHVGSQVVFAVTAFAFLGGLGVHAVASAKKSSAGAHVLGAAFLLLSMGNMRDPTDDIVQQAKQLKQRDEDDSGDPPNPDDGAGKKE
jgi:hypothetical protein